MRCSAVIYISSRSMNVTVAQLVHTGERHKARNVPLTQTDCQCPYHILTPPRAYNQGGWKSWHAEERGLQITVDMTSSSQSTNPNDYSRPTNPLVIAFMSWNRFNPLHAPRTMSTHSLSFEVRVANLAATNRPSQQPRYS